MVKDNLGISMAAAGFRGYHPPEPADNVQPPQVVEFLEGTCEGHPASAQTTQGRACAAGQLVMLWNMPLALHRVRNGDARTAWINARRGDHSPGSERRGLLFAGRARTRPPTAQGADQGNGGVALPGSQLYLDDLRRERLRLCDRHAQVVVEAMTGAAFVSTR
jgi:hypothetical protein